MIRPHALATGHARYANSVLLVSLVILCASCAKASERSHLVTGSPADNAAAGVLGSNVVERVVHVSSKLPSYRFVLTPDFAAHRATLDADAIGRIDISLKNSKTVMQTIAVETSDASWLTTTFHTLDINFDGYEDFAVMHVTGGKWHSESYWLFDPGSGRYITNALTAELRQLEHNGLTLDPRKREVRIQHFIGVCTNSFEIYRVENGHLVLMESEIHSPREPGRCEVERRKRVNGKMVLIETREQRH
jgi:hypothetical protein